jgi:TRAP-type C4-dicarboxylate transport system permease small subunit
MSWVYGFVALGFVLMTYRAIQVAVLHWRRGWSVLERPGEDHDGPVALAQAPVRGERT